MIIKVDENNHVMEVYEAPDESEREGWIEVRGLPDDYFNDPFNWSYIDGEFVYDQESANAEKEKDLVRETVSFLKQSLADSDYKILKFAESLLEVDSITDLLALIIRTRQELRDIVRQRVEWRRQINELEEETSYENQNQ